MNRRFPARAALAAVGGIAMLGLLVRLPSYGDALFGDELSSWYTITGHGLRTTIHIVKSDQELTPPLYYALSWCATKLGNPTETIRLVSLIAGVATIPVTYLVGVRTVGSRAALIAAALVALSPFMIFYSTEARAYALVTLLGLLSTLALLEALDGGRLRWWAAYAACSCAAVYTHYTVAFLLLGQLVWALWTRPDGRLRLVAANVVVLVGILPWLSQLRADQRSGCAKIIGALQPFDVTAVRVDLGRWSIGHPFVGIGSIPGWVAVGLIAGGLAAGALSHGIPWRRPSARAVLVIVLALAVPVGAAIASVIGTSVFLPRNLITSWPGLALVLGAVARAPRGVLRVVAPALLVAGFAVGAVEMLRTRNHRPDYEAAVRFVQRDARRGDLVVDAPFPTPGPGTAVDAAFVRLGGPRPPVLRLGFPSMATELAGRQPGGIGACASSLQAAPPGSAIGRQAARRARGGTIFLVGNGLGDLRRAQAGQGQVASFLEALRPFRLAEVRRFPGLGDHRLAVYVFRAR